MTSGQSADRSAHSKEGHHSLIKIGDEYGEGVACFWFCDLRVAGLLLLDPPLALRYFAAS